MTLEWTIEEGVDPSKSCGPLLVYLVNASHVVEVLDYRSKLINGLNTISFKPEGSSEYCPGREFRLRLMCSTPSRGNQEAWYSSSFDLTLTEASECPAGYYLDDAFSDATYSCLKCEAGRYSPGGTSSCFTCGSGEYAEAAEASRHCIKCAKGTFLEAISRRSRSATC